MNTQRGINHWVGIFWLVLAGYFFMVMFPSFYVNVKEMHERLAQPEMDPLLQMAQGVNRGNAAWLASNSAALRKSATRYERSPEPNRPLARARFLEANATTAGSGSATLMMGSGPAKSRMH